MFSEWAKKRESEWVGATKDLFKRIDRKAVIIDLFAEDTCNIFILFFGLYFILLFQCQLEWLP